MRNPEETIPTEDFSPEVVATDGAAVIRPLSELIDSLRESIAEFRSLSRKAAMEYIHLGGLCKEVKQQILMHPFDRARKANEAKYHEPISPNGQFVHKEGKRVNDLDEYQDSEGWVALCQEHLGLSYKTADRYIADFEAWEELVQKSAGTEQFMDSYSNALERVKSGELRAPAALKLAEENAHYKEVMPAEEEWQGIEVARQDRPILREMTEAAIHGDCLAAQNLVKVKQGEVDIRRAYAGWRGGQVTKGKTRPDPQYERLLLKTQKTIVNAWRRYSDLDLAARRQWEDNLEILFSSSECPESVKESICRAADAIRGR